jgi:phage tail-like protein
MFRLVQLLAAPLDELALTIDDLPRMFDASAVPLDHLDELGQWLAQTLDRRRPEAECRERLAEAFARHGLRGTRADLERTFSDIAGVPVRIDEPAGRVALWSLGEAHLGFETMLIPAEAQGAVVGTTAEVDRSHLITDRDVGWPLNADVAHRFRVHVPTLSSDQIERELQALIDSEKPAHTLATLCISEPGVAVGTACIGPEMVLGGTCPSPHVRLRSVPAVGGSVGSIQIGDRDE